MGDYGSMQYTAPRWLPGGNLQTIWPALYAQRTVGPAPHYRRERWSTPDGDFIDIDWLQNAPSMVTAHGQSQIDSGTDRPLLVLFHGLEGSSQSHYAQAFADFARKNGMDYAVSHFRGCSGELNWGPRAYHSGDHEEIDWILRRFRAQHCGPLVVVGISLGGNALLRWAQEQGTQASTVVQAVAAVSAPIDLAAGGYAIGRGFNRQVYTRMFLNSMKPKALQKWAQHPGLFDRDALLQAHDLYAFDNAFTAPLHGFKNTDDYWARGSAKPRLSEIALPALVVNALNDPFVPATCLPLQSAVGPHVTLWQPAQGGHVGFPQGRLPGHVRAMPEAVSAWLRQFYRVSKE